MKKCTVCSAPIDKSKKIFFSNRVVKYNNQYFNSQKKAKKAKIVNVNFVECLKCKFLYNRSYKQLNYKIDYNSNRSYSKRFDKYLNDVLEYLSEFVLKKNNIKNILEIGFGDGKFIEKIIQFDKKRFNISGYDPSYRKSKSVFKNVNLSSQYYTDKIFVHPDLLIIRHTLEHISNVKKFLQQILHENPNYVFIEVPCKEFVYQNNFHYFTNEHCSYFDNYSLLYLLKQFGYKKINIKKDFNKENILAIFKKDNKIIFSTKTKIIKNKFNIEKFKMKIKKKYNFKYDFLWGAAGKGVSMLNILNIDNNKIPYIVDINKEIEGKFLAKSGVKIISPITLKKLLENKSKIFIMNKFYKKEIEDILTKLKIPNKVYTLID